ncbi:MAG: DUF3597 family protein [Verrucomicrobiae bacterium]|nr:DUF3597 family protein [Verrucomicrobiae bacterium]
MSSLHEALLEKIMTVAAPAKGGDAAPDVDAALDALVAEKGIPCEWRISIIDLLHLFDLDRTWETRLKMAKELGMTKDEIDSKGSAEINLWLLRQIFDRIVERGGKLEATLPV